MNYYLARDGQTYGPYPQESFPGMMQQGQVVPADLVCVEGGSDWVPVSQVPGLGGAAPATPAAPVRVAGLAAPVVASSSKSAGSGPAMPMVAASSSSPVAMPVATASSSTPAAMPVVAAASKLRISGGGQSHSHAPAVIAAPVNYPKASYPQPKTGLMEKAAGAWGALRIVGYVAVGLVIIGAAIFGFLKSRSDRKEIAKLHPLPGWQAFNAGNSQINSETTTAGFGNTSEMKQFAEMLATAVELVQRENFPPPKKSRYRGRSKLGRITSAVSSATSGLGNPQTYVEKRGELIIALIHVPDFSRYSSSTRLELSEACWETTHTILSTAMTTAMKMREQLAAAAPAVAPPPRTGRPPSGRAAPGQPPAGRGPPPAAAPRAPSPPKPPPELTLVVGVRGKSDYECVFVGKVGPTGNDPEPMLTRENVPSHQELVKWFGPDKPATE